MQETTLKMQLPLIWVNLFPVDKSIWGGEEVSRIGQAGKAWRPEQRQKPGKSGREGRKADSWAKVQTVRPPKKVKVA